MGEQVRKALEACLGQLPSVSIDSVKKSTSGGSKGGGLLIRLTTPAGVQEVIVETRASGQPRIVREAVDALLRRKRDRPSAYGVVAAPYVSPRSAEICNEEDMGFIDFAGNCRLCFGGVLIERWGKQNLVVARREQKSLFTQKATRVLRVLLEAPKKQWRIAGLAHEAGVSIGQAFNVKKLLLKQELAAVGDEGISLINPGALLGMWAGAHVSRKHWNEFFTLKGPAEFEAELARLCIEKRIPYALMGFSAASRYAPAVRSNRAMAYVSGDVDAIAKKMGLKVVASGANVILAFPPDESVYHGAQERDGMKIVSPLQAYLDLVGFRGRGDEAAQAILERRIRPTW